MKKLFTLILVLAGYVGTVSAWDNVYLNDAWNSWGDNNERSHRFGKASNNRFEILLNSDELNTLRTTDYFFRFYVEGTGHWEPRDNGDEIPVSGYENCVQSSSPSKALKIPNAPHASSLQIILEYNEPKWIVKAILHEYTETTTIVYVNDPTKTSLGNTVYAYVWHAADFGDVKILGDFPGKPMEENSDGTFSLSGVDYNNGMKVIFSNGSDANKTADLTLNENSVYNYIGDVTSVPVSISSVGYATFSSAYPVDFTNAGVTAYRATQTDDNKVLLTKVTGEVAARTGLVLKGDENSYTIPTATSGYIYDNGNHSKGRNLLVASVEPKELSVAGGTYDYFLAGTTPETVGFYRIVNTQTSAAGKAYYHTSTALAADAATSRASWIFEGESETQGINNVESTQNADVVYDLQGRVAKTAKAGLYIKNGQKFFVK